MRFIDIIASFLGLLILGPLLLVLAVLVKVASRGPLLHPGLRADRFGNPFQVLD